mmetsp:Transcript_60216/g.51012  ORF Transcript_60216/g.51012 Transcript_60216/m.51012 type:complete len:84 (-) Transcript_60216:274-525(-)
MVKVPTFLMKKAKSINRTNHKVGKTGKMMFYKKKTQDLKRKRVEIEKKAAKQEVIDEKVWFEPDDMYVDCDIPADQEFVPVKK